MRGNNLTGPNIMYSKLRTSSKVLHAKPITEEEIQRRKVEEKYVEKVNKKRQNFFTLQKLRTILKSKEAWPTQARLYGLSPQFLEEIKESARNSMYSNYKQYQKILEELYVGQEIILDEPIMVEDEIWIDKGTKGIVSSVEDVMTHKYAKFNVDWQKSTGKRNSVPVITANDSFTIATKKLSINKELQEALQKFEKRKADKKNERSE